MAPVSRRSVLRGLLATSVGGAATPALSGCGALTGFPTTGGSLLGALAPLADGYLTALRAGLGDLVKVMKVTPTKTRWYDSETQLLLEDR